MPAKKKEVLERLQKGPFSGEQPQYRVMAEKLDSSTVKLAVGIGPVHRDPTIRYSTPTQICPLLKRTRRIVCWQDESGPGRTIKMRANYLCKWVREITDSVERPVELSTAGEAAELSAQKARELNSHISVVELPVMLPVDGIYPSDSDGIHFGWKLKGYILRQPLIKPTSETTGRFSSDTVNAFQIHLSAFSRPSGAQSESEIRMTAPPTVVSCTNFVCGREALVYETAT
ncbi:hypothetical protein K469DRAFT_793968 [Zopfia rhizophila CBS 207.26]|uniref:Uncharacterized protein n=1 Tax=Zopfia rhizophila CBS 207.26 TaxID=1314779 RepID=A0A6A6DS86_9PEZI|nr:hypothetical protein K469DRAFT_793968 [Zopfia rhizophila CBS 207.26]